MDIAAYRAGYSEAGRVFKMATLALRTPPPIRMEDPFDAGTTRRFPSIQAR